MYKIFLIVSALLIVLPNAAEARQFRCSPADAVQINVRPNKVKIRYDFSQTSEQLGQMDVDTISPYEAHEHTTIGGLMSGQIQIETQVVFSHEIYQRLGQACLSYDSVNIKIAMDPTVFVASEHKQGTCRHREILAHEKQHVKIDQMVVNKYVGLIGYEIERAIKAYGKQKGPFKTADFKAVQTQMQQVVSDVVIRKNEEMNKERRKKQAALDTREEYERIRNACE